MANRRMFSKTITSSSQFLMMPLSTQALYFQLGMNADDDGFCEHFSIMRMVEAKPDDLRVLQAKDFVKVFDDKVLVVLDWKENNYLRSDRYTPSKYLEVYKEELKALGIPNGNQMATQVRLGKDRLELADETSAPTVDVPINLEINVSTKVERRSKDKEAIYRLFSLKEQPWWRHSQQKKAAISLFDLIGVERVKSGLEIMREHKDDRYCPQASTPFEYEEKLPLLARYVKKHGL